MSRHALLHGGSLLHANGSRFLELAFAGVFSITSAPRLRQLAMAACTSTEPLSVRPFTSAERGALPLSQTSTDEAPVLAQAVVLE